VKHFVPGCTVEEVGRKVAWPGAHVLALSLYFLKRHVEEGGKMSPTFVRINVTTRRYGISEGDPYASFVFSKCRGRNPRLYQQAVIEPQNSKCSWPSVSVVLSLQIQTPSD
jgi:hypothetical protein